jgi:hypothetical protein
MKQPAYSGIAMKSVGGLRNTDAVMDNLFWIGVYPGIGKAERLFIVQTINKFVAEIVRSLAVS